jgi:hypothetical protein
MGIMFKPSFLAIFAALSAHSAYSAWASYAVVRAGGRFSAHLFRLRVLEVRGVPVAAAARPVAFGLLSGGSRVTRSTCKGADYPADLESGVASPLLSASCAIDGRGEAADGYFFEMDAQNVPMRWVVKASGDGGGSWRTIGASTWRLLPSGIADFYPQLPAGSLDAPLPSDGVGVLTVEADLRPPTGWVLLNVVLSGCVMNGAATFACSATGFLGRDRAFHLSFYSLYITACATVVSAGASFGWQCMWREAASTWLRAAVRAVYMCLMVVCDGWLIPICISFGMTDIGVSIFTELVLYRSTVLGFSTLGLAWFQVIFGLLMFASRRQAVAQAHCIVRQDKQMYDALWASVCSAPGAESSLLRLKAVAVRLAGGSGCFAVPRQQNRAVGGFAVTWRTHLRVFRGVAGADSRVAGWDERPIDCLDQLFAQVRHGFRFGVCLRLPSNGFH